MVANATTSSDDMSIILLDQVNRLLEQHVTKERLLAAEGGEWPSEMWNAVTEAGFPLALVTEDRGGFGLTPTQALLLIRRTAFYSLPLPLGESMIAAALWSAVAEEVPEGVLTIASTAPGGEQLALTRESEGYRLSGQLGHVPWGGDADHILGFAQDEEGRGHLVLLPKREGKLRGRRNVAFEPRPTVAVNDVAISRALVREAPKLGADGLLPFGALLRVQQMVGAMDRCLEHSLSYANERKQFGRPLSAFQAVQHMLAEAAGDFAASAAAADGAAEAWAHAEFTHAVALAKARVGEAAGRVAAICHQVHGAMGFTHEHPLHFSTRRLWSWRDEFGNESYWQERIGRGVCARGGEDVWDSLVKVTHLRPGEEHRMPN